MIEFLIAVVATGLATKAKDDAEKIIAGALLSASISALLRKGSV